MITRVHWVPDRPLLVASVYQPPLDQLEEHAVQLLLKLLSAWPLDDLPVPDVLAPVPSVGHVPLPEAASLPFGGRMRDSL